MAILVDKWPMADCYFKLWVTLMDEITPTGWVTLVDGVRSMDGVTMVDGITPTDWVPSVDGATSMDWVTLLDGITPTDWLTLVDGVRSMDWVTLMMAQVGVRSSDWVTLVNGITPTDCITLVDRVTHAEWVTLVTFVRGAANPTRLTALGLINFARITDRVFCTSNLMPIILISRCKSSHILPCKKQNYQRMQMRMYGSSQM